MNRLVTIILFLFAISKLSAQDECSTAIFLNETSNWCSDLEAFNNFSASASLLGNATCYSNNGFDVWFSFRATASDVNITILGKTEFGNFGSLENPEAVLYSGNCSGFLSEFDCESDFNGNGIVELYKGGLIIGSIYYVRVRGRNSVRGTFQICINNYNPPANSSSDCPTGAILCDKSTFTVASVTGAGLITNELDDAPCLGGFGSNSESNSTWFKWRAKTTGNFTFVLTPSNPVDDLDFVLYELPNGLEDCGGKKVMRCMAAGEFVSLYPSPCHGPTGLNFTSTDVSENPGCSEGQDNFLRFVVLERGKSYALAVNNFTTFGNGFTIEFGGTAEFEGPDAEIVLDKNKICIGEEVDVFGIVSDDISEIVKVDWTFGEGINPGSGEGTGPFDLLYETSGEKFISIIVENDLGCKITRTERVRVNDFPEFSSLLENPDCYNSDNGSIEIITTVSSESIRWNTGESGNRISGLAPGFYFVTIEDDIGCGVKDTFEIIAPGPPIIIADMMTANCGAGDGSLAITVSGDFSPYEIDWNEGAGFGSVFFRQNLPAGFYPVSIRDSEGCLFDTTLTVSEYNLELDVNVELQKNPSCIGFSDGEIRLSILNTNGPFEVDWSGNGVFESGTVRQNLIAGEYRITVRNALGCKAFLVITLIEPPLLQLNISKEFPSCYNTSDGSIEVNVLNGNSPFSYNWSGGGSGMRKTELGGGEYSLTITDANNCPYPYVIILETPDSIIIEEIILEDVLCFGDSTGELSIQASGGDGAFSYSLNDGAFGISNEFIGLKAGGYSVKVRDGRGCIASAETDIFQPDSPLVVNIGQDQTIDLGDETVITSQVFPLGRVVNYLWSPIDSLNCTTCDRVRANPTSTTTYFLSITDQNGCTAIDSMTIFVEKNRRVFIPNIFSPNSDGWNDYFTAFADKEARLISNMSIFNRWGALIYEKKNFQPNDEFLGWDGTFKGQKVGQGVYVYIIRILFIDNEVIEYSGDINVLW